MNRRDLIKTIIIGIVGAVTGGKLDADDEIVYGTRSDLDEVPVDLVPDKTSPHVCIDSWLRVVDRTSNANAETWSEMETALVDSEWQHRSLIYESDLGSWWMNVDGQWYSSDGLEVDEPPPWFYVDVL